LLTATYILNRVPSKSIPVTPYELWHGRHPSLDHLRPWGSTGYVHNPTHEYGKLGPRATKMVFIRYPEHSKGYVMFGEYPNGGITEIDSRNVDFLKDEFPSIGEIKQVLQLYELQLDHEPSLGEGKNVLPQRVTKDMTHLLQRNAETLSVPESQPESQVPSRSPNSDHPDSDHAVSPNAQDSGSGSLERENNEDSIPLEDRGSGSSLTQQTNVGPSLRRSERGKIPTEIFSNRRGNILVHSS